MTEAVNDPNPNNEEATAGDTTVLLSDAKPAAPVAAPAPAAAPVEAGEVAYEPTGDVGLDMALDFVGKQGIALDHPAMIAAQNGDFSILKATLASKGAVGWEQFVALGEMAFGRVKEQTSAKEAQMVKAVHDAAGGEEQWGAVKQWASSNATPEEKAEINALLNQGGLAAKGAVKYLVEAYNKANNVVVEPRDAAANAGRAGGVPSGATGPLSPAEYSKAVGALNHKLGGRLEGSKEYEALQRRRMAYHG